MARLSQVIQGTRARRAIRLDLGETEVAVDVRPLTAAEEIEALAAARAYALAKGLSEPKEGEPVYEDHTPYLAQVTAEQLELVQRPGTRPRWAWRLRAGSAANHLLDCEVIASAVAESAGLEEYRLDEVLRG